MNGEKYGVDADGADVGVVVGMLPFVAAAGPAEDAATAAAAAVVLL